MFITADSFDAWLASRARAARKHFKQAEWKKIVRGPDPFTPQELEILAARRRYEWALLNVSATGRMTFRVTNHSDRTLPFLTIGVRAPDLKGGIWLPVAQVAPDETRVVEHDGYLTNLPPRRFDSA